MKYKFVRTVAVLAMSFLCLALTGCSDDDPVSPPVNQDPVVTDPDLSSQDLALRHFTEVMQEMDIDKYRALISPDFIFEGKAGVAYGHDDEVVIMNKIFNEIEGEGGIVINQLVIPLLDPQGVWNETPEEDEAFGQFTDSWYRRCEVKIRFYLHGQNTVYEVTGFAVFYFLNEGTEQDPEYKLLGIKDQTNGDKGVENHSWTGIKDLFN